MKDKKQKPITPKMLQGLGEKSIDKIKKIQYKVK